MKKQLIAVATIMFVGGTILMTSCKKDDTTAPTITLNGSATTYSSLNAAYTDAGATADDDKDGDLTSSISVTGSVNKDLAGTYTLKYTVSDAAGNEGTVSRTVIVRNDAYAFAASYSVHDSCGPTTVYNYSQTVSASTTVNNRITFNKFADYTGNTNIYANITAGGTAVDLPAQTATAIGTASETHTFTGVSGAKTTTGFNLTYTDLNVTAGGAAATCISKWTKL